MALLHMTPITELNDAVHLSGSRATGSEPASQVRYQVAMHHTLLHETAPEAMWGILENRIGPETSNAVLNGLAQSLTGWLNLIRIWPRNCPDGSLKN